MSPVNRQNSTILQNVINKAKARLDKAMKSFSKRKLKSNDNKMSLEEALDFIINTKLSIGATLEEIKADFESELIIDEKMLEELENQTPTTEEEKQQIEELKKEYKDQIEFRKQMIAKVEKKIADQKANTKPAELDVEFEKAKEAFARAQRKMLAIKDYCSEVIEPTKVDGIKANFVVKSNAFKNALKDMNDSKAIVEKLIADHSPNHPDWFTGIDLSVLKVKPSKQEMTDLLEPIIKKIAEVKELLAKSEYQNKTDVLNGIIASLSETLTIYEGLVEDKALYNEVVSELNAKHGLHVPGQQAPGQQPPQQQGGQQAPGQQPPQQQGGQQAPGQQPPQQQGGQQAPGQQTPPQGGQQTPGQQTPPQGGQQAPAQQTNADTDKLVNEYIANINLINANNRLLEQINLEQMTLVAQLTNAREKGLINQIQDLEQKANQIDKENFNLRRRNNEIVHDGVVNYGFVVDQTDKAKQASINPVKYNDVDTIDKFVDTYNGAIKVLYTKVIMLDQGYQKTQDQRFVDEGDKLLEMVSMLKSMISRRIIAERQKNPTFDILDYMKKHAINIEDVKKEMGINPDQPDPIKPGPDQPNPVNPGPDQPQSKPKVVRFRLAIPQGQVQYVNRDKTVILKDGDLTLGTGKIITKEDLSRSLEIAFKRDLVEKLKGMNDKLNILIKRKNKDDKEIIPLELGTGKGKTIQKTIKDLDSIEDIKIMLGEGDDSLYYQGIEEEGKSRSR